MTLFDQLFYNSFKFYEQKSNKANARRIAVYYITLVQLTLGLLVAIFLYIMAQRLNAGSVPLLNAMFMFLLAGFILYIKNSIQYNGKKQRILNAKLTKVPYFSIYTLWIIPIASTLLAILFMQAI